LIEQPHRMCPPPHARSAARRYFSLLMFTGRRESKFVVK
jgi:hypothetical protein